MCLLSLIAGVPERNANKVGRFQQASQRQFRTGHPKKDKSNSPASTLSGTSLLPSTPLLADAFFIRARRPNGSRKKTFS